MKIGDKIKVNTQGKIDPNGSIDVTIYKREERLILGVRKEVFIGKQTDIPQMGDWSSDYIPIT